MFVLDYAFADFRTKCLECTKFTQGCQNQMFADQKKVLSIACIAYKHLIRNPWH